MPIDSKASESKSVLTIDARKVWDAGIGTYLQQLLPRVLQRLASTPCTILIPPGAEEWCAEMQRGAGTRAAMKVLAARPFSLSEQVVLRRATDCGSVLWATSLAHPLFHRGPLVATVHDVAQLALTPPLAGSRLTRAAARMYMHSLQRTARSLLFISEFTRREFTHHVGAPALQSSVTPLGVDPVWFSAGAAAPLPQERPYFVSVSSVRPHKNFSRLLRAFEAVAHQVPHDLIIIGESRDLRTLDITLPTQMARLGGRARFLGRLPHEELRRWVAHADAMVFPSLYEGFGLPPLEAMAAGCPVLCSTAGAVKEVCGEAAIYFDPQDVGSMQLCLLAHAAASPVDRADRVRRGVERARSFRWEHTAELTAAVLTGILKQEALM